MSLDTWMDEFYPISAKTVGCNEDALSAARHSLRKWTGLQLENLAKHSVNLKEHIVYEIGNDKVIRIDYATCALCWQTMQKTADRYKCQVEYVDKNLIYDEEGNDVDYCDFCVGKDTNGEVCGSAYRESYSNKNIEPMLIWISNIVKVLEPPAPPAPLEENTNA